MDMAGHVHHINLFKNGYKIKQSAKIINLRNVKIDM